MMEEEIIPKTNLVDEGSLKRIKAQSVSSNKIYSIINRFNFYFYLKTFLFTKQLSVLLKRLWFVKRILLLALLPFVTYEITGFLNIDLGNIKEDNLASFFLAIGALTGGSLAIVFSLGMFAQQNASDLYSSRFFEDYIHDLREKLTYICIVIFTIFFLLCGLIFNNKSDISHTIKGVCIYLSLFLIGLIFFLIHWLHKNVRAKANPMTALDFLERKSLHDLNKFNRDTQKIAKIFLINNKANFDQMASLAVFDKFLGPYIIEFNRQIENLFEIARKLSDKQEIMATNKAIYVGHIIFLKYIEDRKNSLADKAPSSSLISIEDDMHQLLITSLEHLKNVGEYFVCDKKESNALYIIDIYVLLAQETKNVVYSDGVFTKSVFEQIIGYYSAYLKLATREKSQEVMFEGTKALGKFALIAVEIGDKTSLSIIQGNIVEIALDFIIDKKVYFVDKCNSALVEILRSIFYYQFYDAKHDINETLKNITTITNWLYSSIKSGYVSNDIVTNMHMGKPYNQLRFLIANVIEICFTANEQKNLKYYRETTLILFKEIGIILRELSENIKSCEGMLFTNIGQLLNYIIEQIMVLKDSEEFKNEGKELENLLARYIHLPGWFLHHSPQITNINSFESMFEVPAKTGIKLIEKNGNFELIEACVDSIYSMVNLLLEKLVKSYGYDEPRLMMRLVYIGILAQKNGNKKLLTKIELCIYEFEGKYSDKYISNNKSYARGNRPIKLGAFNGNKLLEIAFSWRSDYYRNKHDYHRLMRDSDDLIFNLINDSDIDRFLWAVWGKVLKDSPIRTEIDDEINKKNAIVNLMAVLKARKLALRAMNNNVSPQ
jgi:hypothetical protein